MRDGKKSWFSISAMLQALAVYIYDEIGAWGVTAQQFVDSLKDHEGEAIDLHINSPGGSVFDGLAIYNTLKAHQGRVDVYIDGIAASMASVIALAGDQIAMAPNALMMIHNPASGAFGDAADMRKHADLLDKVKAQLISIYLTRANVDEEDLVRMMDEETWLTADEALAMGLIDVILDAPEVDVAACARQFDLQGKFGSLPEQLKAGEPPTEAPPASAGSSSPASAPVSSNSADAADHQKGGPMDPETNQAAITNAVEAAKSEERARRDGIRALFEPHFSIEGMKDSMANCILKDVTVEAAKDVVIEALAKARTQPEPGPVGGPVIIEDAIDKFRNGAFKALVARAGFGQRDDQSNEFRAFSLFDLARHSLSLGGVSMSGMDRTQIVNTAFRHSQSSFDSLLADVANKSMLMGYENQVEIYPMAARIGSLVDFKTAKRVGMTEFSDLEEVKPSGEYTQGDIGDYGEDIVLATFGKLFSINRQAIINDDLDAFTRVPETMGRAARRKVGDLFAAVLTANANMADGIALFDSGHSNLASAGTVPSTATIDAGRVAMRTQTDASGNGRLNIPPRYWIGPVALEGIASVVRDSQTEIAASQNNSRRPNYVAGTFEVLADSRFDSDDPAAWYMAADPSRFDTIEIAFLDGVDAPYMERVDAFTSDGVSFKVRIDAAAKALDHRGLYKDPGD